jgi:hypothetical protein
MNPDLPDRRPGLAWRKSRASADAGNCVEVACTGSSVLVRDSKNPADGHLTVGQADWHRFLAGIRARQR